MKTARGRTSTNGGFTANGKAPLNGALGCSSNDEPPPEKQDRVSGIEIRSADCTGAIL